MSDLSEYRKAIADGTYTPDPDKIMSIPIKNGAGNVDVDVRFLPDDVYREALLQGLKVIAERAMSKLTKEAYPDDAERKVAIRDKALANVEDMYAGRVKITGATVVKKASGAVMTEAMRLARNLVKDAMKAEKIKISTVKASDITIAAKAFIEADPSIITTAEANLAARSETPVKINITSLIQADPVLVKKAEEKAKAAKAEKGLSKTQAGKVAPRAKAKPAVSAEVAHAAQKATEHHGHTAH
jgi:hypothetical protein